VGRTLSPEREDYDEMGNDHFDKMREWHARINQPINYMRQNVSRFITQMGGMNPLACVAIMFVLSTTEIDTKPHKQAHG